MEELTVGYSRKVSTSDYGSIGLNGTVTFKPNTNDLQKEFDQVSAHLRLVIDAKLAEISEVPSGGTFDTKTEVHGVPDSSETAMDRPIQRPTPVQGTVEVAQSASTEDGKVFLGHAKVFRANVKRGKTKVYAEVRIGHEDIEAHLRSLGGEGKYVTVKVWEPEYVAAVGSLKRMKDEETGEIEDVETLLIHKNNFVDVWGKFSAWQSDPTQFDFNATEIKLSDKQ